MQKQNTKKRPIHCWIAVVCCYVAVNNKTTSVFLHFDHPAPYSDCQDLTSCHFTLIYGMFALHLFWHYDMSENLTRTERRMLKKLKKQHQQQTNTEFFPEDLAPKPRTMPFVWIIMGFVFIASVFAMVVGAHMWVGHSVWPRVVGWTITGLVGIATFVYWTQMRAQFRFFKRWFLLFPLTLAFAVICAMVFVYFISAWQESSQLKYREQRNQELIAVTSAWKVGEYWNEAQCQKIEQQQRDFVSQLNDTSRPPYMGEVLVLFGTLNVGYQAGCSAQFQYAVDQLTAPQKQWNTTSASAIRGFNNFVGAQYPNSKEGCQMELTRLNLADQTPLHSALKFLCDEVPEQRQWKSGELTAQAQSIVQRLKHQDELKKINEQQ